MAKKETDDLMYNKILLAANLYYKNHFSQQEIAKRLNVSRPWVSKLLAKALELGIVKITIDSPLSGDSDLEETLQQKYNLQKVVVIDRDDTYKDYVAQAAANYFISVIKPNDTIAVGWGNAVSRFINELMPLQLPDTNVVPLAGSFGTTFETLPNYSALKLAERIQGNAGVLHAPAFCSSKEEYKALSQNENTQAVLSQAENADLVINGIGSFHSSFLTRHHILSDESIKELKQYDAVGDFALQFLSKDGNTINTELTKNLIKADVFKIADHARCVIAIAEGLEKTEIIHAVLSRHLVTAFFTNKETALSLL